MKVASLTDVGLKRAHNEDSLHAASLRVVDAGCSLAVSVLVVSDGMGGAAAGEVASRMTCEMVTSRTLSGVVTAHVDPDRTFVNMERVLKEAIEAANRRVYHAARGDHGFAGMGATVVAAVVVGGQVVVGHVGDSRCYRYRKGVLSCLTQDHSFVNELVREGRITAEQAARHPRRNVITRAIGSREHVSVDVTVQPVVAGDVYLLCSDGLSSMISDHETAAIVGRLAGQPMTEADLDRVCVGLVSAANGAGGRDNVSVILAGVEDADIPSAAVRPVPLRPGATLSWDEAVRGGYVDDGFVPVRD